MSKAGVSSPKVLMTTHEHPQILRGLPSLSILHNPDHSPNFLLESTRINGIWCSLHKAVMSCLYCGSSQLSAKMQSTAWRLWMGERRQCHWLLFGLNESRLQVDRNQPQLILNRTQRSLLILFQATLTCPRPCRPGEFRGRGHRKRATSSKLLEALCWGPLGHRVRLVRWLHCLKEKYKNSR